MRRQKAFTLLETIFVIVILGILSSLAFMQYFQVEKETQKSVCKAFAGTLTRTVGHSLWSKSLAMGADGSIKSDNDGDNSKFYGRSLEIYTTIPRYFDKTSVDFSQCVGSGATARPFIKKDSSQGGRYNIFCRDGNATDAPYFVASEAESYSF
jgi:prepilin-type N-terminal cleavage/methylation domain-containing protein